MNNKTTHTIYDLQNGALILRVRHSGRTVYTHTYENYGQLAYDLNALASGANFELWDGNEMEQELDDQFEDLAQYTIDEIMALDVDRISSGAVSELRKNMANYRKITTQMIVDVLRPLTKKTISCDGRVWLDGEIGFAIIEDERFVGEYSGEGREPDRITVLDCDGCPTHERLTFSDFEWSVEHGELSELVKPQS